MKTIWLGQAMLQLPNKQHSTICVGLKEDVDRTKCCSYYQIQRRQWLWWQGRQSQMLRMLWFWHQMNQMKIQSCLYDRIQHLIWDVMIWVV